MPNPTIVSAALNDEELRKSISKLVEDYKNGLNDMKKATTDAVKDIQEIIKSIGSTKVDFSGTLDGLEKAKKKMATAASGGGSGASAPPKDKYADNTIGALEESIRLEKEKRREMKLGTDELRDQNQLIDDQKKKLKQETESLSTKLQKLYKTRIGNAISLPSRTLADAETKLRELETVMSQIRGKGFISTQQINRVQNAIDSVKNKIERLRSKKPMTMQEVLGMDESSVEAIARKMQALKRVTIDPQNAQQVKQLGEEYTRLGKKQNEYLGKNLLIQKSNHMLASTFGYIRNRIIYAFTLGALASFFRDLRNIRAEYEMLDRSLGILVGDFERGTRIFNELNEMALKSPFTLIELGTAAKQLTAYNFAADEVVDTTRRIADISAALGVPIERLVYNLGQIKAQGSLTARDARDFANAGLAIVPMLADMYTKQKAFGKELTTTADVYDMMSKKMVSYGDVLSVIQKVTDEGGKFFNFQARQADTLKVQMANLSLAYNNMMNDIGASNQGLLTGSIQLFRSMFQNWREISRVVLTAVSAFGTYRTISMIVASLNSKMFVGSVLVGLRNYIRGIQSATGAMATFNAVTRANPIALLITALVTAASYFVFFNNSVKATSIEVERFGENASKQLKKVETFGKVLNGVNEKSITYKNSLSELNQILSEYGLTEIKNRNEINSKIERTIELIKEEGKERQYANNIAKGEETYAQNTQKVKEDIKNSLSELEGWFGTTSKIRREILDNSDAITDVTSSIIEENISYVVNKSGEEAYEGLKKIREKVGAGLKSMGLSDEAANFVLNKEYINVAIKGYRLAAEEHENYNQKIKNYYDEATKATKSTMSMTEKVEANSRALRNGSIDALSLYNRVYDIVKLAQQRHTINFDLKLTADNPPKWMLDKSLPELQRLAQRFAAIAQSGGHAEGYDREGTYQQALRYASAARQKQEDAERAARMKNNTKTKKERDAILDTIKEEISLTKKLQGEYDKLTAKGASHADAIKDVQDRYANTIKLLDIDLGKFGLPKFDTNIITGKDPNKQLEYFKNLRDILESKGLLNLDRAKVVDAVIQELDVSAKTFNLDKITKGLNNELDRLKDEYELAVSLDADPELGSMFADWMDIDMSDLPRMAQEYAKEYTSILNKYLKDKKSDIELPNLLNITNENLREFQEQADKGDMSQEWVDNIKKGVLEVREIFKKEKEDMSRDWNALIEKYGGLQAKILKIYKDNVQQQASIVREFGTNDEQIKALDLISKIKISQDPAEIARLQEELAKVMNDVTSRNPVALKTYQAVRNEQESQTGKAYWEDFKDSDLYSMTFTDMANNSTQAIQMIINKLNELKDKVKEDPVSMKALIKSLEDAEGELMSRDPFAGISNSISTWIKATKEQKDAQKELEQANMEVAGSEVALKNAQSVGDKEAIVKAEQKLAQAQQKQATAQAKVVLSGNKAKKAQEQLKNSLQNLSNELGNVSGLLGSVSQIFRAVGDDDTADAIDAINQGFTIMTTVISAVTAALVILQSSNPWLLAMAAALSVIVGLVSFLSGNSNKKITEQVEASERAVKRLELAYVDLQQAVDKAYGTATIGAKQATLANKELQLAEIQRQIQLEKSRTGKNRDEDKIIDLQKQYKELFYEIKNGYTEIVDDLMGTDVASFAENLVSSMIDAFKQGEDYMKVFSDKFDEMIDNMIMKSIVSRVVSQYLDAVWSDLDKRINERTKDESNDLAKLQERVTEVRNMSDDEIRTALAIEQGARWYGLSGIDTRGVTQEMIDKYRKAAQDEYDAAQKRLDAASAFTDYDVDYVMGRVTEIMPELGEKLQNILGQYYKFGESSETQLSALQQGIQGITEDTAGALEGYMNGVSQQVYYQSDLMTQIRDAVVGFSLDVQVATMSQILLQLRSSYEVQSAIHSVLEGWSSPNGMSVRVEMV